MKIFLKNSDNLKNNLLSRESDVCTCTGRCIIRMVMPNSIKYEFSEVSALRISEIPLLMTCSQPISGDSRRLHPSQTREWSRYRPVYRGISQMPHCSSHSDYRRCRVKKQADALLLHQRGPSGGLPVLPAGRRAHRSLFSDVSCARSCRPYRSGSAVLAGAAGRWNGSRRAGAAPTVLCPVLAARRGQGGGTGDTACPAHCGQLTRVLVSDRIITVPADSRADMSMTRCVMTGRRQSSLTARIVFLLFIVANFEIGIPDQRITTVHFAMLC